MAHAGCRLPHPGHARLYVLVAGLFAISACPAHPDPQVAPPRADPACEEAARQRARVPGLLADGKLDRTVRVLRRADQLCPAMAPPTWPVLAETLVDLGRYEVAERVAEQIDRTAERSPETLRRAQAMRDRARSQAARKPDPDGLFTLGVAAKARGDAAEAQRLFDRALVDLQRVASERAGTEAPVVLDAPNLFVGGVQAFAWAPDSRAFAVAHADLVSIEDARTGRERARLVGHARPVSSVMFSPRGQRLLSVSESEGSARVWDAETGRLERVLGRYGGPLVAASFSPDGAHLALAADDRLLLADGTTFAVERTLGRAGASTRSVSWGPDGRLLVTTHRDGRAIVWEVSSGRAISSLDGHGGGRSNAAFSPDGRTIASGGEDHDVRLWDPATGRIQRTLGEGGGSLAWSPDGALVVANNRVYDAGNGKVLASYSAISPISFSPDGTTILAGARHGLALLDAHTLVVKHAFSTHAAPVLDAAWSLDGRVLVSASADGYLRVFDDARPRLLSRTPVLPPHRARDLSTLAISRDGRIVAAVCADQARPGSVDTLCLWDTATGVETRSHPVPGAGIQSVALSLDGTLVAVGGGDQVIRLLDTRTQRTLRELPSACDARDALKACPMTILRFSPDGKLLAGGAGALGVLWDVETGARRPIQRRTDAPFAWSPDGRALGTARYDHPVLDPHASGPWREIPKPEGARVTAVAFSPLGERLALGGEDGVVRLLDARTEREISLLRGPSRPVSAIAFGPLGRLLLTASEEGSLDFWSVGEGRLAAVVRAVQGADAGYTLAAGHIETWGEAARAIPICRAGPASLPFSACAERFESPGLTKRVLRGEPLGLDP